MPLLACGSSTKDRRTYGWWKLAPPCPGVSAVDVVGGAGVLFQHHEMGGCEPAVVRCEDTSGPALDERAAAFMGGLDVPIHLAPHFAVAAALRAYFLRRSNHISGGDISYPWQQEWRPSTRAAVAVNARLLW